MTKYTVTTKGSVTVVHWHRDESEKNLPVARAVFYSSPGDLPMSSQPVSTVPSWRKWLGPAALAVAVALALWWAASAMGCVGGEAVPPAGS